MDYIERARKLLRESGDADRKRLRRSMTPPGSEDFKPSPVLAETEGNGPIYLRCYGFVDTWFPGDINVENIMGVLDGVDEERRLHIRLKSPGGLAHEGLALYAFLRQWPGGVTVQADGRVASAAALMYLGADARLVTKGAGSSLMYHWASLGLMLYGNREYLGKRFKTILQILQNIDDQLLDAMKSRTKLDEDGAREMLDEERFLSGKDCRECGVATGYIDRKKKIPMGRDLRPRNTDRDRAVKQVFLRDLFSEAA